MGWFDCKVCKAKDSEIAFLRKMLAPPPTTTAVDLEANAMLSGNAHIIEITPDRLEEDARIEQEFNEILNGNHLV